MRKCFLLIFICVLFVCVSEFFWTDNYVSANTDYRRVVGDKTVFYADKLQTMPLFYLPYTYYVKVLEWDGISSFCHVEFGGEGGIIDGYVCTDELFDDGQSITLPYPQITITTCSPTLLYGDCTLSLTLQHVFSERTLNYYGSYQSDDGQNLFFVEYNGRLGYVSESSVYPFSIPNHPNELTFIQPPEIEQPDKTPDNETLTFRIIIITLLVVAGGIGLTVALKNVSTKKSVTFYDENDFE